MPIYELGYRHWEGELRSPWIRWWVITRTGLMLAYRSKWIKRLLYASWIPIFYYAAVFWGIASATEGKSNLGTGIAGSLLGEPVMRSLQHHPEISRPAAWSLAFHYFFSSIQAWIMMIVVAIVGSPLIANDVRTKAFLIYFSKPITRVEYLVGKCMTVLLYVWVVTLFPALALYGLSIALAPSIAALSDTWPILFEIVGVSMVISIPTTLVILMLSSLSSSSMYVTVGWLTYWTLGELGYVFLSNMPGMKDSKWVFLLSLRKTCSVVSEAILDVTGRLRAVGKGKIIDFMVDELKSDYSATGGAVFLAILSAVCLAILVRRISAPMRI